MFVVKNVFVFKNNKKSSTSYLCTNAIAYSHTCVVLYGNTHEQNSCFMWDGVHEQALIQFQLYIHDHTRMESRLYVCVTYVNKIPASPA